MWQSQPTIIIKKIAEGRYSWFLYLSNNHRRPSCIAPSTYAEAFKAREGAKEFAAKFKGPLKLIDKDAKTEAIYESGVVIVDETKIYKNNGKDNASTQTIPS